jgi:DNA-binding response OmpR family regulator
MSNNILVVEDDPDIGGLLKLHLIDMGCSVDLVRDGREGLRAALSQPYDLVILDIMLPGIDGLELCRRLRAESTAYMPILMVTARSSELDRVLGLEVGADDYVTKPFSVRELLARVKAVFRRAEAFAAKAGSHTPRIIRSGDVHIDVEKRQVTVEDHVKDLTAKEFDLLLHFAQNPGRVYTRAQLLDVVWGYGHDGYEHTVNSHINRLRAKIEKDPAHPVHILTVWGIGYKFRDVDEHGVAV